MNILRIDGVTITKSENKPLVFHLPERMTGFKFKEFKELHNKAIVMHFWNS